MQNATYKTVNKLSSIDVKSISEPIVSFDLFDTLLRRKYLAVNEVHDTVSAYLLARLGKARDLTPGQLTLTRYNTGNFLKTSPHVDMEEPSLPVIWQKIISTIGVHTSEEAEKIIKDTIAFEFDLELENLVAVEGARDLLRDLKSHNKRLVAVSDMYFSKKQIETILEKTGVLSFFEKVYVSVDVGTTKQTGRLFKHVLSDLRAQPKSVHHIGDNAHSDIIMGSKAGLAVTRIDQPEKLHLERPAYGRRSDIHLEIADLAKSFLFKILFGAINNKTDHIYFMSRDGLLLRQVFEQWKSPFIKRYFDFFDQSDLFLSRAASCWLALNFRGEWLTQAVGFAFWLCHGTATVRQISDLFGIEEVPLELGDTLFSSSTDTARVVRAYETAQLDDKIRHSLMEKRRLAEEYLSEAKLFSARHVTLCDIGYSGTVARDLNSFFLQESVRPEAPRPPKVELELLSTNSNYNSNAALAQPYVRFGGTSILPSHKLPQALIDSFAWLEVFFKHPSYGPLKGYVQRDSRTIPDYDIDTNAVGDYPYEKIIEASAFKSEDIVLLWMSSINFWDQIVDPLIARFAAPDLNTVGQMNVDIYENDAITNRKRSIILLRPDLSATEIYSLSKRDDYWIPGSILASANVDAMPAKVAASETPGTSHADSASRRPARNDRRTILPKKFHVRNLRRALITNIRLARMKMDRRKFDTRFYRSYYPDLATFEEAALRQHFFQHGQREGRFAEPASLIAHLEAEHGALPKDFDAFIYRKLHSDLNFDEEWQLKAHYLQFGRNERRRYQSDIDIDEEELQDLVRSGVIALTAAERTSYKGGASVRKLLFERANIEAGPWLDLFDYVEFQALNYQWTGPLKSRTHALAVFLDRGPANLAALSLKARFDHAYYTRIHPELADASAEEAYRFWLGHGAGASEAASEDDRLFQILGERAFPDAFKVDVFAARYQASKEAGATLDRVDLLALFLQGGFTSDTDLVQGPNASRLWEVVARNARSHGQLDAAIRAYENALDCNGPPGRILHQLGDIYTAQHRLHDALHCYERCVDAPNTDRWAFINGARIAADLGYFDKSLSFISKGAHIWAEKEPWRRVRDHAYRAMLDRSVAEARRAKSPDLILPTLEQITNLISTEFAETRILQNPDGYALLLCDERLDELPQGAVERIRSYVGDKVGRDVKVLPYNRMDSVLEAFAGAACVIFHELTSNPQTIRLALTARALSLPTAYWAGALDGSDVAAFRSDSASAHLASLLASEVATHFISLCDYGLASLPAALDVLERVTSKRKAALVGRVGLIQRRELSGLQPVYIANLSEVGAEKSRMSAAWSMIEKLLSQREHVSIIYDQALTPPRHLEKFSDRLKSAGLKAVDATTNWIASGCKGYISFGSEHGKLSGNAVLSPREATLLGMPVHVVDSADLAPEHARDVRSRGVTALLGFVDASSSRVDRPPQHPTESRDLLFADAPAESAAPADTKSAKRRILFSNVFFAPQTIGGATRVLKDNIDYLLDHHSDEFEIAVLTSDDENDRNGASRIDHYRGIPVMRIATPQELDMDWRPFNAAVYQHALTLLENFKPDLVHIHCLQRLSVAVAEACRTMSVPYIVTLHDAWWLSDYSFLINEHGELAMPSQDVLTQKFSRRIGRSDSLSRASQLRSALAGAEARLSVSQSFGEIYRACGFDVKTIANGVSRLKARPRVPAGDRVRIAHVGGTQHHKGMFWIEAALRRNSFSNIAFSYVDLFRDPGDESQIVWGTTPITVHGKIPSSAIEEIYARTDVLIAPSTWPESFGLVAREALQAGCWVVASDLGAMGDEITDGVNGFVIDIARPGSLVEVLTEIDRNPDRFKQSPSLKVDLRTADDQSRDLIDFYRTLLH
ncbi:HAD-IA family hydrolase [Methylorubrum populi]|uniref:HAD-IA family hydrolase n=1 Tax=Methylorubrum populi TaxID=223967 RepID=UPI0031F9D3E0